MEHRRAVAAYGVAHALAGEALPGFGFALSLAQVVGVAIETDAHADDVRVTFARGQMAQVQAKRTLRLGAVLSKALAQWSAAATSGLDFPDDQADMAQVRLSVPWLTLALTSLPEELWVAVRVQAPGIDSALRSARARRPSSRWSSRSASAPWLSRPYCNWPLTRRRHVAQRTGLRAERWLLDRLAQATCCKPGVVSLGAGLRRRALAQIRLD